MNWTEVLLFTVQYFLFTRIDIFFIVCVYVMKEICACIYKIVNLLKLYDNIHGMTNITKIMLSGIAIIKTVTNISILYLVCSFQMDLLVEAH